MEDTSDSNDLWLLTLQHSPIGMALVGIDGRLLMVNRALCDMLGHDETWLRRTGFQELTHPEDLDADLELFAQALAGEIDSYRVRKRYLHADGHTVWGDLSVALVRRADGRARHFVSQILDVTDQRESRQRLERAHAELEHEHQTLEAIFETVSVGLLLIDTDGTYQRMNRRHRETMALPFPDGHRGAAGQLGDVFHPDGKTLMTQPEMPSSRATAGEEFDDYTYWVGHDPLTRAAFSTSARQVRGPAGERLGAVLAYREVTELMRATRVKDEFVSTVSHELRTPLTSVLGHLELLCENDELPAPVRNQLGVVQRNALRLHALLSDLLQVGQATEGGLELERTDVDLVALLREAVEAARPVADKSEVTLVLDVPESVPAFVDERRIRQVVDNLLSNAVKHGAAGGSARVALRELADTIELEVADNGIGIAPDELEHVFSRFFRGGEALGQHTPGTGLGLNIVDSIVAAHDGSVSVESELGQGTCFRVVLPGLGV